MRSPNGRSAPVLLCAAVAASLACSHPQPRTQPASAPPPRRETPAPPEETPLAEADVARKGAAACGALARERGLSVVGSPRWTRTDEDRWDARLAVRPAAGGLEYEMGCRYDARRDKASLYRP